MNSAPNGDRPPPGFNRDPNSFKGWSKTTDISPRTLQHLRRVYGNLTITSAFAALANYLYMNGLLFEPGILAFLGVIAAIFALSAVPPTLENSTIRHGLLYGFGFLNGWTIAPLVNALFGLNPASVYFAIVATMLVFGSFSASSLFSPRRSFLYLGGLLGSISTVLLWSSLANMWFGSTALFNLQLYLGLFMFCGYVIYDTQIIVENSEAGWSDPVQNAAQLFTHVAAIFVRLLIILSQNESENRRKRRNQR